MLELKVGCGFESKIWDCWLTQGLEVSELCIHVVRVIDNEKKYRHYVLLVGLKGGMWISK
jgi:hypothetical protein